MQRENIYAQVQPEMIAEIRRELKDGRDIYEIYAKYKNLSIREEAEGGDIEVITRYQFACDLAKHMITEKAMQAAGYHKSGRLQLWEKNG